MKIMTIIGARPQIIKASAISRTIEKFYSGIITEFIVHTGQHYDHNMSNVFFGELKIPKPTINLNVGSGNHGIQTAKMIESIEITLLDLNPDYLVLYGDTNSTLAGSIAASKIGVPIVHIEAGLRSFNRRMPEEINRVLCDHTSALLFSPTQTGVDNLIREGFSVDSIEPFNIDNPGVFLSGDVMLDNSLHFQTLSSKEFNITDKLGLKNEFVLATVHRDYNTDNPFRLKEIFDAFIAISHQIDIVLPLHPRTKKILDKSEHSLLKKKIQTSRNLHIINPVSFLGMIELESKAKLIITDSGGVQKEAYFFKKKCIILRTETEWTEIIKTQNGVLANPLTKENILSNFEQLLRKEDSNFPNIFGDGNASKFILDTMQKNLQ